VSVASATQHYLTDQIDPLFIRGARDYLWEHVQPGRILNLGLGYGAWDERLSERDDDIVGLDLDAALVEHFRARYPRVRYVHTDVFEYQPDGPLDTIVASHFLEHVDEPVELLGRMRRWLAPDGRIVILVPNAESIHRRIGQRMGLLAQVTDLNEADLRIGHRRVYTADLLRAHCLAAYLRVRLLTGVTFKPLSNAQLAQLPRSYVDACVAMAGEELGSLACQLAAVVDTGTD
jgi:SAM-dependent methyltransferase